MAIRGALLAQPSTCVLTDPLSPHQPYPLTGLQAEVPVHRSELVLCPT